MTCWMLDSGYRLHEGEEMVALIHSLRDGFATMRTADESEKASLEEELLSTLNGLSAQEITQVVRALGSYAALLNVVEEAHEHFLRRAELIGDDKGEGVTWKGRWDETMRTFTEAGMSRGDVEGLIAESKFLPVFTAHLTEARRAVILTLLSRMFHLQAVARARAAAARAHEQAGRGSRDAVAHR